MSTESTIVMGEDGAALQGSSLRLPIGSVFAGRYTVEGLLGRGGMGVVYKATDRLVDERVALKLLDVGAQLAEEAVEMFRREVRVARRITHPNVVRIHGLDEHRGVLFISMEYIEGTDLRHEMEARGGSLEHGRAARVALEVAQALGAAHAMGVVHRDLKPENVLVDGTGRSVLSDFGIARMFDKTAGGDAGKATRVIGTPAYMAPEQVASAEIGPAADLYALGIMLFEMLIGRTPFVGDNPIAVAVARLNQPAPDVRAFGSVPEHLALLVADLLQTDPANRPESALAVATELEEFLEDSGLALSTATRRPAAIRSAARTQRAGRSMALPFGSGRSSLACLPFTYRGPAEHDYLGEALSGELIDVLSRTKGLRVLSSGAVANVTERDPRKITEQLEINYVVDGTVQVAGPKLRVSVRLVDATGSQLFSERFDLGFDDLFEMQDEAGRRIAEALRLEVVTRASNVEVSSEAMQWFLQARRILRSQKFLEAPKAVELLERALAAAPSFPPALSSLAIATVHVWFYPQGDRSRNWEAAAETAVNNALAQAADMVETHVAAARMFSHRGKLREAVESLRRAIGIAPTSPDAHHLLGQLECETGRSDEGLARMALAHQLEPTGVYPYEAARVAALRGDHTSFDKLMVAVRKLQPPLASMHLELRHAAWWGDEARLRKVIADAPQLGPFAGAFTTLAKCYLNEDDPLSAVGALSPLMIHVNARFGSLFRQILVEVHCHAKDHEGALEWLAETHAAVLYDVPWLESCPLLEEIRELPAFQTVLNEVRARCAAVWSG